ncbi:MAG: putative porin, partial [Planctomycetota bacterium]
MRQAILAVTLILLAFGPLPAVRANETSELRQQILKQSRQLQELQQRLDELEAKQKQQSEQMEKEISEAVKDKQLGALPDSLKWAEKVKISGDLRYRHEHTDEEDGSNPGRWQNGLDRERIRARLMFEAIVNDEWDVAFRIASGNDRSPISANQDLEDAFSQKNFWLDLAYFDWHPAAAEELNVTGGKIKNPFYVVGKNQLIWDVDLNPEGIAAQVHKPLSNGDQLFVNGGGFWVDESSSGVDT